MPLIKDTTHDHTRSTPQAKRSNIVDTACVYPPRNAVPKELILDDSQGASWWTYSPPILPENSFIDQALKLIDASDDSPYLLEGDQISQRPSAFYILRALDQVREYRDLWTEVYTPGVNVFLAAYDKHFHDGFGFLEANSSYKNVNQEGVVTDRLMSDWVNDFVDDIRKQIRSKEFKRAQKNWAGDYRRRMKSAEACVEDCFEVSSKLRVVRTDLYQERLSLQDLNRRAHEAPNVPESELKLLLKRIDRLLNNRRHNKLFKHLINQIIKIEYGHDRGYHVHLIMFFDGNKVRNDSYYSKAIGDYWVDKITDGKGSYWAGNWGRNKRRHKLLGIGLIERTDAVKRKILMNEVIHYLAKRDLKLRSKACVGQKLFRIGKLHRKQMRETRRGRPRKAA